MGGGWMFKKRDIYECLPTEKLMNFPLANALTGPCHCESRAFDQFHSSNHLMDYLPCARISIENVICSLIRWRHYLYRGDISLSLRQFSFDKSFTSSCPMAIGFTIFPCPTHASKLYNLVIVQSVTKFCVRSSFTTYFLIIF